MLNWQIKHFNDLSLTEFHDIVALRIKVFVVEQDCPYQELDGKDKKSYHLLCRNEQGDLVGTFRILPPGVSYEEASIGRVVLDEAYRGAKNGHAMMREAIAFINKEFNRENVRISGQKYLEKFYVRHGFVSTGKEYLEDGIPHVEMILNYTL